MNRFPLNKVADMYDWQVSLQRLMNATFDPIRPNAKADIITFKQIEINKPAFLLIEIRDFQGKAIEQFDLLQTHLMHLLVISDDLHTFDTLYPTYQGNGRFTVRATFSRSGEYTLFSRYQPNGQPEVMSALTLTVLGLPSPVPAIRLIAAQQIDNTEVYFHLPQPITQPEQKTEIAFDLRDKRSDVNQNINVSQKVNGTLVIVRRTGKDSGLAYIPTQLQTATSDQIIFTAQLSQPELYKLWFQFERDLGSMVADFWLNVESLPDRRMLNL
jgi:hypothetical protein